MRLVSKQQVEQALYIYLLLDILQRYQRATEPRLQVNVRYLSQDNHCHEWCVTEGIYYRLFKTRNQSYPLDSVIVKLYTIEQITQILVRAFDEFAKRCN